MLKRSPMATIVAFAVLCGAAQGVAAQTGSALKQAVPFPVAPVPFGPGEQLVYRVSWGIFGTVGQGVLEVAGIDTIRGHPSYHLEFKVRGGVLFAKVDDYTQSWMDTGTLSSHRFDQNIKEVNYKRHRIIEMYPEEMRWARKNSDEEGELMSPLPLDDVSFLYYVRTLPLEVGDTYTLDRYWRDRGNPVVVKVLRKDTAQVDGVDVPTIVVQPIIQTKGAFSEDGEAEVHFSDDTNRLIVYLRAGMSIGTLKMNLERYTPGTQLAQDPSASGGAGR